MEKCLRLKIFAKIHHDSKHYITIEVFGDFEHSQIFTKNSVANKFQSTLLNQHLPDSDYQGYS